MALITLCISMQAKPYSQATGLIFGTPYIIFAKSESTDEVVHTCLTLNLACVIITMI